MPGRSGNVRIKRVYEMAAEADGARVLVDRIWPRGLKKERASVDLWLKEIAPSTELREWFSHDPRKWAEFRSRYRAELEKNEAAVGRLLDLAGKGTLTLLYAARDTEYNNAVALLDHIEGNLR